MNLLYNYAKYAGKRDRKRKKAKETRTIKCRKMVTKVYFLGFEAIFSQFLNKNTEKLYNFAAYLKMEVKTDRKFSPKILLTNYL